MATNLLFKSCVAPPRALPSSRREKTRALPPPPRRSSALLYKAIPVVTPKAVLPSAASALTKFVAPGAAAAPKLAVAKPYLPSPAVLAGRSVVM